MGIRYEMEVGGLDRLLRGLEAAPEVLKVDTALALEEAGYFVLGEVDVRTPVVTGQLRASERVELHGSGSEVRVLTTQHYAGWVEGGRGPVHARPGGLLKFRIKGRGRWLFKKSVGPAEGRWMFRDGLNNSRDHIQRIFEDVARSVARSIRRGG